MGLKKSRGNMYPWVTHTHCHLGGECPHRCVYCYVDNPRFGRALKYQGPVCLIEKELSVKYGPGKTIFVENCNDLFAKDVPNELILEIYNHLSDWLDNTYVFQTKNPKRMRGWLSFQISVIFGTTIETNRYIPGISLAPHPQERMEAMIGWNVRKFVTVEPVMDFDVPILSDWICRINPEFVNIGADSKGHGLPEPSHEKVAELIMNLKRAGIEVREKPNLFRLMNKQHKKKGGEMIQRETAAKDMAEVRGKNPKYPIGVKQIKLELKFREDFGDDN